MNRPLNQLLRPFPPRMLTSRLLAGLLLAGFTIGAPGLAWGQAADSLPSPLHLEQALQIARGHRAEIVAARARAQAFAQRPAIVSALEDPMIYPSLDHLPFMLHGADVSLAIEQRFPLSGVRDNRRRSAEADAQRVRAEASKVELDVELDAASAFLMLQERREMARILEEQTALAQQFVRAATSRYSACTGNQADALRAEIEVARLKAALKSISAEVRAAEVMLNTSLGRPAEAALPALDSTISASPPPTVEAVRQAAIDKRP